MRNTRKLALVVATMAAGLPLAVSAGSASSAPSPNTPGSATVSESAAESAAAYWTPARMASAKPVDNVVAPGSVQEGIPATELGGAPISIAPSAPVGGGGAGGGGSELATEGFAVAVPKPYTNYPDKVNGKVFFTKPGIGNFVCSGTAVNAPNKSIVWTAGHCVENGASGGFHTNWVFVPAYSSSSNGSRPFGTWSARELWSLNGWMINGDLRYDLGAVVVNRVGGRRLVDRIGGDGIKFNINPASRFFSAFGYPQAAPFNGWTQWRCNDLVTRDPFMPATDRTLKMFCNMTGGSSGGGWKIDFLASGLAYVNSVNSYKYNNNVNFMYGQDRKSVV